MNLARGSVGIALLVSTCSGMVSANQTATKYPRIEVYTAPSCRSCKAASDYLTANGIPFTRKDVYANEAYLDEMNERYRVSAVPLIVIGNGQKVLRGFVPEAFQAAVRDVMVKSRQQP